jgi:hypothetical protein
VDNIAEWLCRKAFNFGFRAGSGGGQNFALDIIIIWTKMGNSPTIEPYFTKKARKRGMTMDEQGLYTQDIKVGYAGDYAAVTLALVKPVVTQGERHEKFRTVCFDVIKTSDMFNLESLSDKIGEVEKGGDVSTLQVLKNAWDRLTTFVQENGKYNPAESIDWEPV